MRILHISEVTKQNDQVVLSVAEGDGVLVMSGLAEGLDEEHLGKVQAQVPC